jgi:predicted nucleic acid-binding protein
VGGRTFIDTNVFVYAEDADVPEKQAVAREHIRQLAREERGVISTQILMEYVAAGRRRLGLTLPQCRQGALIMCQFDVVLVKPEHVLGALDLASIHSLSHWDALLIKTGASAGCSVLLTENLNHGQRIDGITIYNPFNH